MTFLRQQTSPGGRDALPALDKQAGCRTFVCMCACEVYYCGLIQGLPNANSIRTTSEMALELLRALRYLISQHTLTRKTEC